MRYLKILPILLLFAVSGLSQWTYFTIEYVPQTNILEFRINKCDQCIYVTANDRNACACHVACDDAYWDCVLPCIANANGLQQIQQCKDLCELQRTFCKENCDPFPENSKSVFEYRLELEACYNDIPDDPFDQFGTCIDISIGWTAGPILDHDWYIPSPWPTVYTSHNTCYRARLYVEYTDGSNCIFVEEICNIIG